MSFADLSKLRQSRNSGLLLLVLIGLELFLTLRFPGELVLLKLVKVLQVYFFSFFFIGFVRLGVHFENKLMLFSASGLILYQLLWFTLEDSNIDLAFLDLGLFSAIFFGALLVSLGSSFFLFKKKKWTSSILGLILLVFGIGYLSVSYAWIFTLLLPILYLLLVDFLQKFNKKL